MAELTWAILCYKANIDQTSNQISLVDVMEEVTIASPLGPDQNASRVGMAQHMELVTHWHRTVEDVPEVGAMALAVVSPAGNTLAEAELEIRLDTAKRYRGILKTDVIPFDGFGKYTFRISRQSGDEWHEVGNVTLEVKAPAETAQEKKEPQRKDRARRPKRPQHT